MKKIFLVLFLCSAFSTMAKEVEEKNDVNLITEKAEFQETSENCWVVNWTCQSSMWCQMDTTLEESLELIGQLEKELCG